MRTRFVNLRIPAGGNETRAAEIVRRDRHAAALASLLYGIQEKKGFIAVTDAEVLNRLDEAARGKVLQADLKAMGITDLGEVAASGKRRSPDRSTIVPTRPASSAAAAGSSLATKKKSLDSGSSSTFGMSPELMRWAFSTIRLRSV